MSDVYKSIEPDSSMGEMIEKFKNVDLNTFAMPNIYPKIEIPDLPEIEPIPLAEHIEKTEEYQKKSLEMLHSINENTANLYSLVDLISKSNEKQDEILELISEILTIAKAKEKKEAESIFKKVMTQINDTVDTADSMIKLVGWASAIYNVVNSMLTR
jgi:hypothetical protein